MKGENDCHFDAGNYALNTGYGCTLPPMLAAYRAIWSVEPGTTAPDFPFGMVLLADGSDFGTPGAMANIVRSQTANFGSLPNAAMPNSFLVSAFDLGDPWTPGACDALQCCVESWVPLGANCTGDHRGEWTNSTGNAGALHPRTKGFISDRIAQGAFAFVYEPAGELLDSGPVLSGCTMSADGKSLTLSFDASRLKGERIVVGKPDGAAPMSLALENTATYVLVNNTLPQSAFEGRVVNPYHGPYETGTDSQNGGRIVPGNEFGVSPWVAVLPAAGAAANSVTIDLAPLGGQTPTAIRYALGSGCDGDFLGGGQGRVCCGPSVETSKQPCPPGSCPIKVRGRASAARRALARSSITRFLTALRARAGERPPRAPRRALRRRDRRRQVPMPAAADVRRLVTGVAVVAPPLVVLVHRDEPTSLCAKRRGHIQSQRSERPPPP